MRKRKEGEVLVAAILLVVITVLLITGCGENDDKTTRITVVKEPLPESTKEVEVEPESMEEVEGPAVEFEPEPAVELEPIAEIRPEPVSEDDERYELYKVKEGWIKKGGCFIERDGKFYALYGLIPTANALNSYYIGSAGTNTDRIGRLFIRDSSSAKMPTNTPFARITIGDLPILQISRTEKIGDFDTDTLSLTKTSFVGYSISVVERANNTEAVFNSNRSDEDVELAFSQKEGCGVSDLSGNPVKDFRNLEYKEDYIFHWYSGAEYHEVTMKADCKVFKDRENYWESDIVLQGEQNGEYFEFDLSELKPGFYLTSYGVFELVD